MNATGYVRSIAAAAILILTTPAAQAGSGMIDFATDTIDLTMNCRFAATAGELTTLQDRVTQMSHVLWDATEGQLRIGDVTITCNETTLDVADYWVFVNPLRSHSPAGTNLGVVGTSTGTLGAHVTMAYDRIGGVFAHEFGHLGFSLGDEYPEKQTQCGGKGPCFEPGTADEQNQCLMQQIGGLTWSEFCVAANHDPVKGNNAACLINPPDPTGAPCNNANCTGWSTTTLKYESSSQEMRNHESCWKTLTDFFPQLTAPAGLPVVAEPGAFVAPTFTVTCAPTSTMVLVLDASGSMAWNVDDDSGEVCANGIDDDGDGMIDEAGCKDSRMNYVKAAGRAILELAEDASVKAGIVRFDSTASTAAPIQTIAGNLASLETTIDGLSPGSRTAIGSALNEAKTLIDADPAPADGKAAMIITDGQNNEGPDPATAAAAYEAAGIRIYAIATGGAANDATISDITFNTNGYALNENEGDELVTAVGEMFAQYTNGGVVFPQTPYAVNINGKGEPVALEPRGRRFSGIRDANVSLPGENEIGFDVEEGTRRFTALLGGNLGDMRGFGVNALLIDPDGATISTSAPPAGVKVKFDPYYTLVKITNPKAGHWRLRVSARPGAAPTQTGTLVVVSDNPRTHLFASVDKKILTAPAQSVTLSVLPSYISGLRDVALNVTLRRPDGSLAPVPIAASDSPEVYKTTLSSLPMRGRYELLIDMRTNPSTTNDPGENHPDKPDTPELTVPIPPIERSITRTFYVAYGPWVCPQGKDCDHDGITGEPADVDKDGDGIPAVYDNDDNDNEVPDAKETGGGGVSNPLWPADGKRRWWWGGAVGSSHPLGRLDKISDANIYAKLDAAFPLTPVLNARLMFGLAQFTAQPTLAIAHPRYTHLSANLQAFTLSGISSRFFVNAGPGLYRSELGTNSAGVNVGLGVEIGAASPNVIELGLDYHHVSDDRGRFLTWHLGILFH